MSKSKLKTLKDMNIVTYDDTKYDFGEYGDTTTYSPNITNTFSLNIFKNTVDIADLRNTAKEWIEILMDYRYGFSSKQDKAKKLLDERVIELLDDDFYHIEMVTRWIKYFFNLEDE